MFVVHLVFTVWIDNVISIILLAVLISLLQICIIIRQYIYAHCLTLHSQWNVCTHLYQHYVSYHSILIYQIQVKYVCSSLSSFSLQIEFFLLRLSIHISMNTPEFSNLIMLYTLYFRYFWNQYTWSCTYADKKDDAYKLYSNQNKIIKPISYILPVRNNYFVIYIWWAYSITTLLSSPSFIPFHEFNAMTIRPSVSQHFMFVLMEDIFRVHI